MKRILNFLSKMVSWYLILISILAIITSILMIYVGMKPPEKFMDAELYLIVLLGAKTYIDSFIDFNSGE